MKKIINQRKYDTETAKALATYETDLAVNNNAYYAATLYRKRNGEYFLYGKGNAGSPYSEMVDGAFIPGEKITPLTVAQAKSWAQDRTGADTYEAIFGPSKDWKDDYMKNLHIQVDVAQYSDLKDKAAENHTSVAEVIRSLIDEHLNTMSDFKKIVDPKARESGWAIKKDGKLYLDNDFARWKRGTRLILDDDNFTINEEATLAVNKNI